MGREITSLTGYGRMGPRNDNFRITDGAQFDSDMFVTNIGSGDLGVYINDIGETLPRETGCKIFSIKNGDKVYLRAVPFEENVYWSAAYTFFPKEMGAGAIA